MATTESTTRPYLGIDDTKAARGSGVVMIPFQLHRRIPLLRRPFHQRDRVMEQRDQLRAERDLIIAERDHAIAERDLVVRETERLRGDFIETANATLPATPFGRTSMPELVDPSGTQCTDHRGLSGVHRSDHGRFCQRVGQRVL